ncbi:MAG: UDP-N-acetylmuramoyl-tripeptide--D-alanyl-D-alanine ligase [Bacteroidaceae bacterium]|nr:UDP-N-acetylmuramoyl-tripeptide--D-alanyl-D-alanine ligase [Bacteroidaceae bacterium]
MKTEQLYEIFLQHPIITTDSRDCPAGSIFFALRGASFNGNQYAASALEKGCTYAVVEKEFAPEGDERFIAVENPEKMLQDLAAYHREQLNIPVLQITGTNGKTTTKELIACVLQEAHNVLFTEGNLNNHLGVPRTLLRITKEHDIAIIETGANHPGEIAFLCNMVKANYGLITNVGRAHLEGFGSFQGVKNTKGELYDDLQQRHATIFLNALDEDLLKMAEERGFRLYDNAIPYVEGRIEDINPFVRMQWRKDGNEPWHTIQTHLIGGYNISNLRAAVTVGLRFGITPEQIRHAIENYVPSNSRSEYRKTEKNSLIVDAYNANPSSMIAALTNFQFIDSKHKMVILGDMRELGADSEMEHRKVMDVLAGMPLEDVWLVGENFASLNYPNKRINPKYFKDVEAVKEEITHHPLTGKTILIKGSNGTKLFQLPEYL